MMRFTGFRQLCEKHDFQKSNMDGILARDLNIDSQKSDGTMDMISPGSAIQFKGHHLKRLNKLLGIDGDDVALKLIQVKTRNKYGVQIQDITGACDNKGLNIGREYGPYAGLPFPHAPCSPTNGKIWWISAKDWDHIRMPLPPGAGGAAGGGAGGLGGLGGGLGGGVGGLSGMPSTPTPEAGAGGGAGASPASI